MRVVDHKSRWDLLLAPENISLLPSSYIQLISDNVNLRAGCPRPTHNRLASKSFFGCSAYPAKGCSMHLTSKMAGTSSKKHVTCHSLLTSLRLEACRKALRHLWGPEAMEGCTRIWTIPWVTIVSLLLLRRADAVEYWSDFAFFFVYFSIQQCTCRKPRKCVQIPDARATDYRGQRCAYFMHAARRVIFDLCNAVWNLLPWQAIRPWA